MPLRNDTGCVNKWRVLVLESKDPENIKTCPHKHFAQCVGRGPFQSQARQLVPSVGLVNMRRVTDCPYARIV
jgi:hypothetical protein